ncbi:MAG: HD domain-containing phosphohydrolase, partial [Lachnospiraceae bacterium]|nr:HD domain-containing phosphohydrolase [Lachnospiraceae bacterium]
QIAVNVAHYHHEKWDGTGYPEKLHGEAIPLEARIMALADVFDALVSKRCYKNSWNPQQAREEILSQAGHQFDPQITKLFDEHFDKFLKVMENYPDAP